MMLRDILDLPTEVKKSDFVIRLAEDVARPEALLDRYAITDDLVHAFDKSLALAGSALRERRSTAAYVHGSFGSGKSQFMGVLSLLLANHPAAWNQPKLHSLFVKHDWVKQRKVLRLHFHMIGAESFEDKVFPAYLEYVAEHHKDAPVPALFADAKLFDGAEAIRKSLGDEQFFTGMNAGQAGKSGWGKLGAAGVWDPKTFEAARRSADPSERERLAGALARTPWLQGIASSGNWRGFDEGLAVLSRHAASLGYDGIAFFLDELVLWLASRASDRAWLNAEAPKIVKLVEAQDAARPIPLVSYVARQRDIAELVGEQFAGADAIALRDSLRYWEGRLDVVPLEDRNLPAIVKEKVVRPRDAAASTALDDAFDRMRKGLGNAWGTLLGESWTEKDFRNLYPFTPALVEALVALSHYLQRERTALKVLMELLVHHLRDFQMGQVVPVGDLWDVLAGGEEPMDGVMRERFAAAKRLYQNELLPVLQTQNGTTTPERCQRLRDAHPVFLGCSGCPEGRCRTDNRLVKTLLLGALVPQVPVLHNLSVTRLVQLNHGTLRAAIPGAEANLALARLREWASQVSKLRVEEGADPRVQVELEGIDLRPMIDACRGENRAGARRRKVLQLLYQEMGIAKGERGETVAAEIAHQVDWRGTTRYGSIYYGNVREMEEAQFIAREEHDFRIVLDYPFDEGLHGPSEDERRVHEVVASGRNPPTLVWLPSFFGENLQRDVGELVIIDHLLDDGGVRPFIENLRPEDQQRARAQLESLRSQKSTRVRRGLLAAYGLKSDEGELDPSRKIDRHFHLLRPGAPLGGLPAPDLARGLTAAIHHVLGQRYPRHPDYLDKVTRGRLEKALRPFGALVESELGRMNLDEADRPFLVIAHKLGFAKVNEEDRTAVLRKERFLEVANRLRAENRPEPTVEQVAHLFDETDDWGLTPELADYAVICFAMVENRLIQDEAGRSADLVPGKLPRDARVVSVEMPSETAWQRAIDLAGHVFGTGLGGKARTPANLAKLVEDVRAKQKKALADGADRIAAVLGRRSQWLAAGAPRLATAERAAELLGAVATGDRVELVEALANANLDRSSPSALGRHMGTAADTCRALEDDLTFNVFDQLATHGAPEAAAVLEEVRKAMQADALHVALPAKLRELGLRAQAILKPKPDGPKQVEVVARGQCVKLEELDRHRVQMEAELRSAGPGARLVVDWRVEREKK